jgi:hypothetical protein
VIEHHQRRSQPGDGRGPPLIGMCNGDLAAALARSEAQRGIRVGDDENALPGIVGDEPADDDAEKGSPPTRQERVFARVAGMTRI